MFETQIKDSRQSQEDKPVPASGKAGYRLFVLKFLSLWVLSLGVIFVLVLLSDINWARPQIQKAMAASLHRKVSLGSLSWSLSFNGLAIGVNRIALTELDGQPFLSAQKSEIGVAFWPLVHGKIVLHYLHVEKPEFWAMRLADKRWNYSDLLDSQVDIRFIECDEGRLHILDLRNGQAQATAKWPNYDLEHVKLNLVWPRHRRRWPFYLAFDLKHPDYTSRIKISAVGQGLLACWAKNTYSLDLKATNVSPKDLAPFYVVPNKIDGLFDVDISSHGALNKLVNAKISLATTNLTLTTNKFGTIHVPKTKLAGIFAIDPEKITWKDLQTELGNITFHTQGECLNWQKDHKFVEKDQSPTNFPFSELFALFDPDKKASGKTTSNKGQFQLTVSLRPGTGEVVGLKPSGKLDLSTFVPASVLTKYPFVASLLSKAGSNLTGQLHIYPSRGVEVGQAELAYGSSQVHSTFEEDYAKEETSVKFESNKAKPDELMKLIDNGKNESSFGKGARVGGRVDLSGTLAASPGKLYEKVLANLLDVTLDMKDKHGRRFNPQGLTGQVSLVSDTLFLKDVKGTIGGGKFKLDGEVSLDKIPRYDLRLSATKLDLSDLSSSFDLLGVHGSILDGKQLTGTVANFNLNVQGAGDNPKITLACEPLDLFYQPQGLGRPLHVDSGKITYENDNLVLNDCTFVCPSGKLTASLAINKLTASPQLTSLKSQSPGIDLADVNYYLSAPVLPSPMQKAYTSSLSQILSGPLDGRVSGTLEWQPKGASGEDFQGEIALDDARANLKASLIPVRDLSALVVFSGSDLTAKRASGAFGQTTFHGKLQIKDWQSPKYSFDGQVKAEVCASELTKLIPELAFLRDYGVAVAADRTISLNAKAQGSDLGANISYSLLADPNDRLRISSPKLSFAQPAHEAASLAGESFIDWEKDKIISFKDNQLALGSGLVQLSGNYSWKKDPELELSGTIAKPLSGEFLASAFFGGKKPGRGIVSGDFAISGQPDNLVAHGKIKTTDLSLPEIELANATGDVETSSWPISFSNPKNEKGYSAFCRFNQLTWGALAAKDLHADLGLDKQTITFKSAEAEIAGGHIAGSGSYDLVSPAIKADINLNKINANRLLGQLTGYSNELTGTASGNMRLESRGQSPETLLANLDGSGRMEVTYGRITRFGRLQEKLTQANFVQQGLFGFNLNNLLQSVVPVRTGEFRQLDGDFQIANGNILFDSLHFAGPDMRLWASGKINLPQNTIKLEIAGNIPRVSSSIIAGPLGELTRDFTIQNVVGTITRHKLEGLPSLPILGDIASSNPRTFSFTVLAPFDHPDLMAKSIEKTFHWLPNHPNASAHPIPAI